jgi:hypothetical protein
MDIARPEAFRELGVTQKSRDSALGSKIVNVVDLIGRHHGFSLLSGRNGAGAIWLLFVRSLSAEHGPGAVVSADSLRRPGDEFRDTSASNRDGAHAISEDCPGRPGDTPDPIGRGIPCGADAGIRLRYKPSVAAGKGRVETAAGNSSNDERQTRKAPLPVIFQPGRI